MLIRLQAQLEKLDNEMREVNTNSETLRRNQSDLIELKHILTKTQTFYEEVHNRLLINIDACVI